MATPPRSALRAASCGDTSPCHPSSRGASCPCGTGRGQASPRSPGEGVDRRPSGRWVLSGLSGECEGAGAWLSLCEARLRSHFSVTPNYWLRGAGLWHRGKGSRPLWGLGLVGGGDSLPDPPGAPRVDEVSVASFGRQPWLRRWVARPCEHGDRKHSGRQQTVALATGGDSDTRARNREAGRSSPVWAPGPGFHGESPGGNGPGPGAHGATPLTSSSSKPVRSQR